jgi:hypothetical protein
MAVDEPRQQRAATAVDDAAGLEGRCQGGRTDPCDTLVLDHDRAAPERLTAGAVDDRDIGDEVSRRVHFQDHL